MKKSSLVVAVVLMAVSGPVTTAFQAEEVLDLVAMPLAIAAVSEVTGVPSDSLTDLAVAMNDVSVPPAQFVEIVRYSPVLLVDPTLENEVVTFVRAEVHRGISAQNLVIALRDRIRQTGIEEIEIVEPPRIVRDRTRIVPDVVVRRVDELRSHPHGGPPGQIKKQIGVQTGAEVVHGTDPQHDRGSILVNPSTVKDKSAKRDANRKDDRGGPPPQAGKAHGKPDDGAHPGKAKGQGEGKGKDRGDR